MYMCRVYAHQYTITQLVHLSMVTRLSNTTSRISLISFENYRVVINLTLTRHTNCSALSMGSYSEND